VGVALVEAAVRSQQEQKSGKEPRKRELSESRFTVKSK